MVAFMKLAVLVKMVPDVAELRFDESSRRLIREGVRSYMNPFDRKAVEEALRLKDQTGGSVHVVTMGPPNAEEMLREAIAMGADEAYLLTDKAFAGSDTLATANALSAFLKKAGGFTLVLGGKYSVDAETGQLMPEIAEKLGYSVATNVTKVQLNEPDELRIMREDDDGYEEMVLKLPAVVSVSEKINKARTPTMADREKAKSKEIHKVSAAEISKDTNLFGAAGSPTVVSNIYDASLSRSPKIFRLDHGSNTLRTVVQEIGSALSTRELSTEPGGPQQKSGRQVWCVGFAEETEFSTSLETISGSYTIGLKPVAVTVGPAPDDYYTQAAQCGARNAISVSLENEAGWSSSYCSDAISKLIADRKPFAVLFPSTVKGREVGARVAARLGLGLTGDAVDLQFTDGQLIQVKPAFGGNIMAQIYSKTSPQMATVRPGVFKALKNGSGQIDVEHVELDLGPQVKERVISHTKAGGLGSLEHAEYVLCIGAGVGSKDKFDELKVKAERAGFTVAATRKVVDAGWAQPHIQVGLTGKSIGPRLYVAVAVSGAVNHVIGVRRAGLILAVNSDEKARIFQYCDIGLVANYQECIDELLEALHGYLKPS